ncbi:glycosyl transferase [Leuconostoc litchii]|uniref:Glycosyltransferase family 39 protein n=1 Tax=Leuconostoc litchii TaxID=1981069 RepID=A0A6P2CLZ9_9LACO|nr:glycosyltransferase family 39 protein [Leuconostoc litchii]TYC47058.1 glycosyltransferase family 39 protein [Leuconostoc litchii]GMA68991.1 glycosyl transferase [Leuconostoc litchii]
MQVKKRQKTDWYLVSVLLLGAFLYGWGIWDAGSANSYYTAAITSMTKSWSNFWYGAFDPAGFITVDKPPVALWFMAISAKIFGVHGWSVVLPSVLAGIGSIFLMYKLLVPKFGLWAGRIGALVLALTPTVVANSRTNNMDAILVFFLLLAVFTLQKAVSRQNVWLVIISFGLIGVGFNIKMLQAFMILPAMLVFYWVAIKLPWKKKLAWLVVGLASLSIFTLAYPVAVDSVDKSNRPYIGSSQSNSLLELAFGYNGTERLLGQSTGTGGAFPGMGNTSKSSKSGTNKTMPGAKKSGNSKANGKMPGQAPTGKAPGGTAPTGKKPTGTPPNKNVKQGKGIAASKQGKPTGNMQGGGNSAFAIGSAGPFRLFQSDLGSQIGWYLPLAILGLIAGWFGFRKRGAKWYHISEEQSEVLLWAGWFVPVYGFFSVASFFHPYYTIMLAPAIAALTAIGVSAVVKMSANNSKHALFSRILISIAVLSTLLLQSYYVWSYYPVISVILIIMAIILAIWWLMPRQMNNRIKILLSAIGILAMAGWWSLTPTLSHNSAAIPAASPSLLSQQGSSDMGGDVNNQLLSYTKQHQGNAKYLFATTDSNSASGYIIKSGKSVMAIGGYNGTDPTMTLSEFKALVKSGQLKYFVMGNNSKTSSGQISKILSWVKKNGTKISYSSTTNSTQTQKMGGQTQASTLYDLSSIYQ